MISLHFSNNLFPKLVHGSLISGTRLSHPNAKRRNSEAGHVHHTRQLGLSRKMSLSVCAHIIEMTPIEFRIDPEDCANFVQPLRCQEAVQEE
jgi:hypothetical protein